MSIFLQLSLLSELLGCKAQCMHFSGLAQYLDFSLSSSNRKCYMSKMLYLLYFITFYVRGQWGLLILHTYNKYLPFFIICTHENSSVQFIHKLKLTVITAFYGRGWKNNFTKKNETPPKTFPYLLLLRHPNLIRCWGSSEVETSFKF